MIPYEKESTKLYKKPHNINNKPKFSTFLDNLLKNLNARSPIMTISFFILYNDSYNKIIKLISL